MSYIDGFIASVPESHKDAFLEHSRISHDVIMEAGAISVTDCWDDDVPEGEVTSMRKAVQARPDEKIVFSWIVWPDKTARDAGMKVMMEDPRMNPETNPMPFDGKRLIYGGFVPVVQSG